MTVDAIYGAKDLIVLLMYQLFGIKGFDPSLNSLFAVQIISYRQQIKTSISLTKSKHKMVSFSDAQRSKRNRSLSLLASLEPRTRAQKKRNPDWKPLNGFHPDIWASNQRQLLSLDCHPFYEVEEIIDQKVSILGDRTYKIRWCGYGPSEDSWEPAENLYCPQKLVEFFDCRTNQELVMDKIKQEPVENQKDEIEVKTEKICEL